MTHAPTLDDAAPRNYRIVVDGLPFSHVHVRARSRGRARYLCARSFRDAGLGSVMEGLQIIRSCTLDSSVDELELVYPCGTEGLLCSVVLGNGVAL